MFAGLLRVQTVVLSLTFGFHLIISLVVGPVLLFAPHLYSGKTTDANTVRRWC